MIRVSGGEACARYIQLVVLNRPEYPQAGLGTVFGKENHLNRLFLCERLVQVQQSLHERKCDTFSKRIVNMVLLIFSVSAFPLLLKYGIRRLHVKESTR